jgi:hypothetical protein
VLACVLLHTLSQMIALGRATGTNLKKENHAARSKVWFPGICPKLSFQQTLRGIDVRYTIDLAFVRFHQILQW